MTRDEKIRNDLISKLIVNYAILLNKKNLGKLAEKGLSLMTELCELEEKIYSERKNNGNKKL